MRRGRYVLDNFATVAEAVEGLKKLTTIDERMCTGIEITDGVAGFHLGAHMVRIYFVISTSRLLLCNT